MKRSVCGEVLPCNKNIRDLNGHEVPTLGMIKLRLGFENVPLGNEITSNIIIVPNSASFQSPLLLGTDILNLALAKIDLSDRKITFKIKGREWPVPLKEEFSLNRANYTRNNPKINNDRCAEYAVHAKDTFIAGALEQIIQVGTTRCPNGTYMVEKLSGQGGLALNAEALVTVRDGQVPILLINPTEHDVEYTKGTMLAKMKRIEEGCEVIPLQMDYVRNIIDVDGLKYQSKASNGGNHEYPLIKEEHVNTPLTGDPKRRLVELLNKYRQVVALPGEPLGRTTVLEQEIVLEQGTRPIYTRQYPLSKYDKKEVNDAVEEMLERGVIENSVSPWNSPLILVKKKDGTLRVCIDFRRINAVTVADKYPLPRIAELLQSLHGTSVYSSVDLQSAYWQIGLREEDRPKTAFTTEKGHFQFNVMPYGLTSAGSVFSRLMAIVLSGMIGLSVLVYLDDVVIFSETLDEHFDRLEALFERLQGAGLRLKLSKCTFMTSEIKYLGHRVSKEGISVHPDHYEVIKRYPVPKTKKQVRSFLGLISYFRSYVHNFAKRAEPMIKLLRKQEEFKWENSQDASFSELKQCLLEPPILIYPDFDQPFFIATDASDVAIGSVLAQQRNGKLHPIHFISRTLSPTERRYSTTKREALAVIYSLKQFRYIVYGHDVTILTDHQALAMLFRKTLPDGQLGRWSVLAAEYNVKIRYLAGKLNVLADALSRIERDSTPHEALFPDDDDLIVDHVAVITDDAQEDDYWTEQELIDAQRGDERLAPIIKAIESKSILDCEIEGLKDYLLNNRILHIRKKIPRVGDCDIIVCIAIPAKLEDRAIRLAHDQITSAHLGVQRTITKLRYNYDFPDLDKKARKIVGSCETCLQYNGRLPRPVPSRKYPIPDKPFERIAMDLLGPLPITERGNQYIMVVSDFLTRFVLLFALPNKQSDGIAEALRVVFATYGTPLALLSDNANEFCSQAIAKLCNMHGVNKYEITPYHPASNGLVERQNVRILRILRIYTGRLNTYNWDVFIPEMMCAMNSTLNASIGDTPFYALYHYDRRDLFDANRSRNERPCYNFDDYMALMENRARQVFDHIKMELEKQANEYLTRQAKGAKERKLKIGQRVYCKHIPKVGESRKLAPKFVGPCVVLEQIKATTYKVKEIASQKVLTHHVDNIVSRDINNDTERETFQTEPKSVETPRSAHTMALRNKKK